jgi:hypothetical protein
MMDVKEALFAVHHEIHPIQFNSLQCAIVASYY